jgi:hypothetical protein
VVIERTRASVLSLDVQEDRTFSPRHAPNIGWLVACKAEKQRRMAVRVGCERKGRSRQALTSKLPACSCLAILRVPVSNLTNQEPICGLESTSISLDISFGSYRNYQWQLYLLTMAGNSTASFPESNPA